jgi:hypothetical protein
VGQRARSVGIESPKTSPDVSQEPASNSNNNNMRRQKCRLAGNDGLRQHDTVVWTTRYNHCRRSRSSCAGYIPALHTFRWYLDFGLILPTSFSDSCLQRNCRNLFRRLCRYPTRTSVFYALVVVACRFAPSTWSQECGRDWWKHHGRWQLERIPGFASRSPKVRQKRHKLTRRSTVAPGMYAHAASVYSTNETPKHIDGTGGCFL